MEVTRHRARLASGCWPSSAGRDSNPQGSDERFLAMNDPPLPSFLAQCRFFFLGGKLVSFFRGENRTAPKMGRPGADNTPLPEETGVLVERYPKMTSTTSTAPQPGYFHHSG